MTGRIANAEADAWITRRLAELLGVDPNQVWGSFKAEWTNGAEGGVTVTWSCLKIVPKEEFEAAIDQLNKEGRERNG